MLLNSIMIPVRKLLVLTPVLLDQQGALERHPGSGQFRSVSADDPSK